MGRYIEKETEQPQDVHRLQAEGDAQRFPFVLGPSSGSYWRFQIGTWTHQIVGVGDPTLQLARRVHSPSVCGALIGSEEKVQCSNSFFTGTFFCVSCSCLISCVHSSCPKAQLCPIILGP